MNHRRFSKRWQTIKSPSDDKRKKHKSNQDKTKNALYGVCGGEKRHMKEMTESNLCAVVSVVNTLL